MASSLIAYFVLGLFAMMSGVTETCTTEDSRQPAECLSKATDDIWMPDTSPLSPGKYFSFARICKNIYVVSRLTQ